MTDQAYGELLVECVLAYPPLVKLFDALDQMGLKDYYVGAGCLPQLVWNHLSDKAPDQGIKDIDLVYFDPDNLGADQEANYLDSLQGLLDINLDIKNQARVHLWYPHKFGRAIKAFGSLEEAIDTWPTNCTALGLRRQDQDWLVYAPFGLECIFQMTLEANNRLIGPELYQKKRDKWSNLWPDLKWAPWSDQALIRSDQPFIKIRRPAMKTFGVRQDKTYKKREGVYGICKNDQGHHLVIALDHTHFLVGGGIEEGEDRLTALRREFLEEIGYDIHIHDYLGPFKEYHYSKKGDVDYEMIGHVYRISLGDQVTQETEDHHEMTWLRPDQVLGKMQLAYQEHVLMTY